MNATIEQARLGLLFFLEGLADDLKHPYAHERDNNHARLLGHPFNLETSLPVCEPEQHIYLVAYPGHTDISVRGLLLMLQDALKGYHPDPRANSPFRLRIIYVEQEDRNKHNLYFELITPGETFLAGGCTDYSGTGGRGGRQLSAVFDMVSFIHGIIVEKATIPSEKGELVEQAMRDAYDRFTKEKEEYAA